MSERTLYILGTSAQVPTRYRNHCGYFLKWDEEGFLFDPGEGTQRQLLLAGLSASQISKIFISHFHGDHCLGLPGVLQRLSLDRAQNPIEIYFPDSGYEFYERLRDISLFHNAIHLVERPLFEEGVVFSNEKLKIEIRRLDHTTEVLGYRITEKERRTMQPEILAAEGVSGRSIGELERTGKLTMEDGRKVFLEDVSVPRHGQSLAYVTDTRLCPAIYELAREVDVLICEATYLSGEEALAKEYAHLTALQAAQVARDSNAKKLILTHFSQRYPSSSLFEEEARQVHPDTIAVNDGDQIYLPKVKRSI